jgi:hypothetical protein
MDDDLRTLATLLATPEPSDATIGRGRRQLVAAIRTPARRHRAAARGRGSQRPARWLAGGLGLAAAATAAAVVLSTGSAPAVPRSHPPVTARADAAQQAKQRILLAAAISAAAQQLGTYWHYKSQITMTGDPSQKASNSETDQEWTAHDGRYWSAQPACGTIPAGVVAEGPGNSGFVYGAGDLLTYQQTEHLPTSPAALAAWFARYTPPGTATDDWVAGSLISMEWLVPTPPQVRAAGFRALAALPNVTSLGPVPGGQELLIKDPQRPIDWLKVVIDPATSLVRSETNFKSVTTIEAANWTNHLPRIVPLCGPSGNSPGAAVGS